MKTCDCKLYKYCPNCDKRMRPCIKTLNGYCKKCAASESGLLKGRRKCVVRDCENWTDQGVFVGELCAPCHRFVSTGEGKYSQAYRNSIQVVLRDLALATVSKVEEFVEKAGRGRG